MFSADLSIKVTDLFDLEKRHSKSPEYKALEAILKGDPAYNKCAKVVEQVSYFIDHATDPNIFGRTWGGSLG